MATEVNVKLTTDTKQFDNAVKASTLNIKGLDKAVSGLTTASALAFAGLSASIGLTVKKFADFDNELRGVKTLLNENSFGAKGLDAGFNQLTKDVIKLGSQSAVGLSELNKSLFDTISAGVDASKSIEVLRSATQLATAGLTDVATATDGVTSALGAYGFAADQANSIAAKFFAAQVEGKTTIAELASSFGLVGATAASAGVKFNELLAAVSASTTAGIRTNAAYTGLKAVLANVAKPTAEASAEAKRLGVEFNASALRSKGLEGFLKSLTEANGFTKDSITKLFGSVEAQNIIFALAGNQASKFSDIIKKLGDEQANAAQFTSAFNTQNESLSNQFKILSNKFDEVIRKLGEEFAPTALKVIGIVSDFLDLLSENDALLSFASTIAGSALAMTGLIAAVGGLIKVGATLDATLTLINLQLGTSLGLITALSAATGIGLAIGAITLLTKAFSDAAEADKAFNDQLAGDGSVNAKKKQVEELAEAFKKVGLAAEGISDKPIIFLDQAAPSTLKEALDVTDSVISGISRIPEVNQQIQDELNAQAAARKEAEQKSKEEQLAQDQADFEKKLEDLRARKQLENETIDEYNQRQFEAEKALVDKAQANNLNTKKSEIKSTRQLEEADRKRRIGEFNAENALRVKDRINSNEQIAKANAFFRTKEVQQTQQFLGNLSTLQNSNERTLFTIGKIAALSQAIINTAQGATKALAQGGVLGPALAASVVAAGAVQIATIRAQKFTGAAQGGLLEGGTLNRDSIPVLGQDRELISPKKNFDEVIGSVRAKREADKVGNQQPFQQNEQPQQIEVIIGFMDNAFQIIEQKIIERRTLNIGLL